MPEALDKAVSTVIGECMGLQPGEEVLVICNPITGELGDLFRINAQGEGGDATLAVISERDSHVGEPPRAVAAAMLAVDVILAPTIQSISHTEARKAASDAGVRVASMPGITDEMLARVMGADMRLLRRRGGELARILGAGAEARITCARGSDLRMVLADRTAIIDAGQLDKRGAFGNIPCGEAFIAPVEGTGEGRLIVDGSIAGIGRVSEPVELELAGGHLTGASGADGALLMNMLSEQGGPEGTNLAELGIGTNEAATLTGSILEDEKILGSAHVAFGASKAIGGTVQTEVHLDCVAIEPTVEVDGETIVEAGRLA